MQESILKFFRLLPAFCFTFCKATPVNCLRFGKSIDTVYIKQNAFNFIFTNNLNDKTISLPINIDDDNNYYVVLMLDNPVQVNSDEFLAKNGWRDKFDSMSTLSDLKYCTEGAKTFIRSMLSCNNYSNYGFGQSGYYITGLPGHTVYVYTKNDSRQIKQLSHAYLQYVWV